MHQPPGSLRVGIDVVDVDVVAAAAARWGDRYLSRVYTPGEIASCSGTPRLAAQRMAARFAAKEATIKALQPTGPAPRWTDIEVLRLPSGACSLALTGTAASMAADAGLGHWTLSLTHEGRTAAAVVVAGGAAG